MKKISLILLLMTAIFVLPAAAGRPDGKEKVITVSQLPQKSQEYIKANFEGKTVTTVHEIVKSNSKQYEVQFSDGTKVEFGGKGGLKSVKGHGNAIPATSVPPQITSYVNSKYPGVTITNINHENKAWNTRLSNGLKVKFDDKFKMVSTKQATEVKKGKVKKVKKEK